MLSNVGIKNAILKRDIGISPWDDVLLNPCSYDLTLGSRYRKLRKTSALLDLCEFDEEYTTPSLEMENGKVRLNPGECMLAVTEQHISLGPNMAAEVAGKSSLGRLFQAVHVTAGFVDAGFEGWITMEVVNMSPRPVVYTAGQRIGQIIFTRLDSSANPCYDTTGQYSNQLPAPIPAKKIKKG
jgi:dCTP deaminase